MKKISIFTILTTMMTVLLLAGCAEKKAEEIKPPQTTKKTAIEAIQTKKPEETKQEDKTKDMTDVEKKLYQQMIEEDAKELEYPGFDGEMLKLSDYFDDIVILNYWAVGCPPCVSEMPELNELNNMDGITVVTIAPNRVLGNNFEGSKKFIEQFGVVAMWDEDDTSLEIYKSQSFPHTYIIDRNGKIRFKTVGSANKEFFLERIELIEKYG